MLGGLYVSGALTGLLSEFLDSEGLAAQECRRRLASWSADSRLPLTEWIALLELIQAECPRPALGLAIGQRIKPRHAGVLGYLSLSCDTLGEAMLRFNRYHRLVYDGNPIAMQIEADRVTISWGVDHGKPGQLADETAIAAFATLTRMLADEDLRAVNVEFVNPAPADPTPYTTFFACPVSFNHPITSVSFPAHYLRLPLTNSDPALKQLLEQQAETLLQSLPTEQGFESELQQALIRALHDGEPTLEQVALRLHLSPRTLQRRLAEKGLGFQNVLDNTRMALAKQYLADRHLALTEIALLLGYSEQSAFNRAFKRWYGDTPRQLRHSLLGA